MNRKCSPAALPRTPKQTNKLNLLFSSLCIFFNFQQRRYQITRKKLECHRINKSDASRCVCCLRVYLNSAQVNKLPANRAERAHGFVCVITPADYMLCMQLDENYELTTRNWFTRPPPYMQCTHPAELVVMLRGAAECYCGCSLMCAFSGAITMTKVQRPPAALFAYAIQAKHNKH